MGVAVLSHFLSRQCGIQGRRSHANLALTAEKVDDAPIVV